MDGSYLAAPEQPVMRNEESSMFKFTEIIGSVLESISENDASYVDVSDSGILKVKGKSLAFDSGWFVIENPYQLVGVEDFRELIGSKVLEAYSNDIEIRLEFERDIILSVSLKDEDFVGPEAASYAPKRGNIIVFD